LYRDDFYGFFNDRKERLLQKIEKAMGKEIPRTSQPFEEVEGNYFDNGEDEEEIFDNPELS
jgi:hypothetical protein